MKKIYKNKRFFGCYQMGSVSGENYAENHRLKLSMGFAVEPMERHEKCLAFVIPLKSTQLELLQLEKTK